MSFESSQRLVVPLDSIDVLAFSGAWVAAAASALTAASSLAMGIEPAAPVVTMSCAGTLAIYNLDRLCDVSRDRHRAPRRTAFVLSHRKLLGGLVAAGAATAVVLVPVLGRACLVLAPALILGLLHRRLKEIPFAKLAYVTFSWLSVVVVLPATAAPHGRNVGWVCAILAPTLLGNALASDVRDGDGFPSPRVALRLARLSALVGLLAAAYAPSEASALAMVPAATLLSLARSSISERWGLLVVDGALIAGSAAAILLGSI